MAKCMDIQKELDAFLSGDVEKQQKGEIQGHLDECSVCSKELQKLTKLSQILQTWGEIEPSSLMFERVKSRKNVSRWAWKEIFAYTFSRKMAFRVAQVAAIVVLTLVINSWLHKPLLIEIEEQASINLYLQEHQSAVVQSVSAELLSQPATQMYVGQDDILYFEYVEEHPKVTRPGMILIGPRIKQEIALKNAPAISKGQTIEQNQVQDLIDFEPVLPEYLPNGYVLSSIRIIDESCCLHLIFTRKLDTVSFFQQPSHSKNTLTAQDFRDYAVFISQDPETNPLIKGRGTTLAWSDNNMSFVLIGDADLSELMDMVHFINQANK